jgi:hypothetical protein
MVAVDRETEARLPDKLVVIEGSTPMEVLVSSRGN